MGGMKSRKTSLLGAVALCQGEYSLQEKKKFTVARCSGLFENIAYKKRRNSLSLSFEIWRHTSEQNDRFLGILNFNNWRFRKK